MGVTYSSSSYDALIVAKSHIFKVQAIGIMKDKFIDNAKRAVVVLSVKVDKIPITENSMRINGRKKQSKM
jgi:hypothetical protein